MSLLGIQTRTKTVQRLREELISQGYSEVIPKLTGKTQPIEPTIYPFVTSWDRLHTKATHLYLTTSPESYLKKCMANGMDNCFAIAYTFRNQEGENELHSPEFLMAEWYTKNSNWRDQIKITEKVVTEILGIKNHKSWPEYSWIDLWKKHLKLDLKDYIDDKKIKNLAKSKGYEVRNATWEQLFYQLSFNEIEPNMTDNAYFLTDFPTKISRLAKPQTDNPDFCERFELLMNGIELADGNTEYFDEKAIRKVMEDEQKWRKAHNEPCQPLDEDFLKATKALEGQSWSGVGLGVDRLAMLFGKISQIRDVQEI